VDVDEADLDELIYVNGVELRPGCILGYVNR
jgi:hypothetical protein